MLDIQNKIGDGFYGAFKKTPLAQRLDDIDKENRELQRYYDIENIREELGDLLCSAVQLANESGWDIEDLINNTLNKIKRRGKQYNSLARKTRVALYGGSFNPMHNGHFSVAKLILDSSKYFDEVWLVPCNDYMGKKLIEARHRIAMCELYAKKDGRLKVFDYDIRNNFKGETFWFLKNLLAEDYAKDQYEFSYVLGMDQAKTIRDWPNSKFLERMINFVIVARPGIDFEIKDAWFINSPDHMYLEFEKENKGIKISSTEIRNLIATKDIVKSNSIVYNVDDYIDKDVLKYIYENGLYL